MTTRAAKIRALYLKDVKQDVANRLSASIHNARFLDLGIEDNPSAIRPPWGYHNPETHQLYESITDAFNGSQRRLLLLGQPGSGKTTTLLHLAKLLIEEAENNSDAPVPFVLNLSTFRFGRAGSTKLLINLSNANKVNSIGDDASNCDVQIDEWLALQLSTFPGLSSGMAREWIHEGRVAILLDGLDEFNDERRGDLALLLNRTFLSNYPYLVVVICSRTNEYQFLKSSEETRLQLRGCVQLQPLNDEQVSSYLEAAHAQVLLNSLPGDAALRELAQTPLTLSMLVLAYGDLRPGEMPSARNLSERRHLLFESYVARMLQRQARRKQNVPFDDSRANDVALANYQYNPQMLNRWLGWLALVLSMRMRTIFATENFHSILRLAVSPERQLFNFCAVYTPLCAMLGIFLSILSIEILPGRWKWAILTILLPVLSLPLVAIGAKASASTLNSIAGQVMSFAFAVVTTLLAVTSVAHVLSLTFPSLGISALPMSIVFPSVVLAVTMAGEAPDRDTLKMLIRILLIIAFIYALHFIPSYWHVSSLTVALAQSIVVTIWFGVCLVLFADEDSFWARMAILGSCIGVAALFILVTWWFSAISQIAVLMSIGGLFVLILAISEIEIGIGLVVCFFVFAFVGAIMGGYAGAIVSVILFWLIYMSFKSIMDASFINKTSQMQLMSASRRFVGTSLDALDKALLSPFMWLFVATGRRFPLRRLRFISFCQEAFLIKQSAQEFEFVHRLLRDYFALRELLPHIASSDRQRQLETIRSLGYQGEAALDTLSELASHEEALVRASALSGLSHISSPIATAAFMLRIDDSAPEVRQELILGAYNLPQDDITSLLERLKPLGNACEVGPLLIGFRKVYGKNSKLVRELLIRVGASAVDPLIDRLRDRDEHIRAAAAEALGLLSDSKGVEPLIKSLRDRNRAVRAEAAKSLGLLGDSRAIEPLRSCVRDRDPRLRNAVQAALRVLAPR